MTVGRDKDSGVADMRLTSPRIGRYAECGGFGTGPEDRFMRSWGLRHRLVLPVRIYPIRSDPATLCAPVRPIRRGLPAGPDPLGMTVARSWQPGWHGGPAHVSPASGGQVGTPPLSKRFDSCMDTHPCWY
ncbi:hypothetical protein GCM10027162_65260 [Streptomyces incanus]